MRLETKRLILRDYKIGDLKDLVKNINNLKVSRYLLVVPYPYKKKDGIWWLKKQKKDNKKKKKEEYNFAIELKEEKKLIGCIGINKIDYYQGKASIGYWLGEDYWRQGIMSEALPKVLDFAFKKLKLRRLEAGVFTENKASIGLLRKFGFKQEGIERKSYRAKSTGKIHDNCIHALLKKEFKK
jgi:RimJ/RimL family protein N-acetyltransferase